MGQNVGSINLDLLLNSKGFERGVKQSAKSAESVMGSSMKKIGGMIAGAFAIGAIVNFTKACLDLGSNLAEVQNVVDTTFTTMNEQVNNFANNAISQFGLSQIVAKKYMGTFGAMSKAFGFSEKEAYAMSTALTGLAGDVASFYNLSTDEAYTKLKSVFTGETESLKDLGVVMTQAALDQYALANGYGKTTAQMSEQEKVALRYAFVQKQLSLASGDFMRTQDGWANQTRVLKLRFDELKATLGQAFINILTPVVKMLNILVSKLQTVANGFKAFTELFSKKKEDSGLSGIAGDIANATQGTGDLSSGLNNVGDTAVENAKKITKSLMGFDELNTLTEPATSSDSGTQGGLIDTSGIDMSLPMEEANSETNKWADNFKSHLDGIIKKAKELWGIFKDGFNLGLGDANFSDLFDEIKRIGKALKDIFLDKEVLNAVNKLMEQIIFTFGKILGNFARIGIECGTAFFGGIANSLEKNAEYIKGKLIKLANDWTNIFKDLGNISQLIADIFTSPIVLNAINGFGEAITTMFIKIGASIADMGTTVADFFVGSIKKFLEQNGERLKKQIASIFDLGSEIAELEGRWWELLANLFSVFRSDEAKQIGADIIAIFSEAFFGVIQLVGTFVKDLMRLIIEPLEENSELIKTTIMGIFEPIGVILDTLKKGIQDTFETIWKVYEKHVKPAIDNFVDGLSHLYKTFLEGWNTWIKPVLDYIAKGFKEMWEKHVQPCINAFITFIGKLVEALSVLWKNFLEPIISFLIETLLPIIAPIIKSLWNIIQSCISSIMKILKGLFDALSGFLDFIIGVFTGDWGRAWDGIKNMFKGVWDAICGILEWAKNMFMSIFQPIIAFFQGIWNSIKNIFSKAGEWFSNIFKGAFNGIKNAFSSCGNFFSGIWSGIKNAFGSVTDWFKNTFSKAWQAVKDVFSTGGKVFDGMKDGIVNTFKTVVNAIISGINKIIGFPFEKINSLLNKIKDLSFLGISPFDWIPRNLLPIPKIPMLAQGGYVKKNQPQLAMIGDNKTHGEIVAPENKMYDIFTKALSDFVGKVNNNNSNQSSQPIRLELTLQMDKREIGKQVIDFANGETRRMGKSVFIGG